MKIGSLVVWALLALMMTGTWTPASATSNNAQPPANTVRCLDGLIQDLLLIDSTDQARLYRFFKKSIDQNMLGGRSYGGRTWKYFSEEEKEIGLQQYFALLMTKQGDLTAGMQDVTKTVITHRLATNPAVKPPYLHIISNVTTDAGKKLTIVVYLTPQCKAFDLVYGGVVISRQMDVALVENIVRERKKKR